MPTKTVQAEKINNQHLFPLPTTGKERLRVWQKAAGIWKNKKRDPIKELVKMREGWERKLPKLKINIHHMKNIANMTQLNKTLLNPILGQAERLTVLDSLAGKWKGQKTNAVAQLKKMRSEPERKLPKLK